MERKGSIKGRKWKWKEGTASTNFIKQLFCLPLVFFATLLTVSGVFLFFIKYHSFSGGTTCWVLVRVEFVRAISSLILSFPKQISIIIRYPSYFIFYCRNNEFLISNDGNETIVFPTK